VKELLVVPSAATLLVLVEGKDEIRLHWGTTVTAQEQLAVSYPSLMIAETLFVPTYEESGAKEALLDPPPEERVKMFVFTALPLFFQA
jgi:hypothetical protein